MTWLCPFIDFVNGEIKYSLAFIHNTESIHTYSHTHMCHRCLKMTIAKLRTELNFTQLVKLVECECKNPLTNPTHLRWHRRITWCIHTLLSWQPVSITYFVRSSRLLFLLLHSNSLIVNEVRRLCLERDLRWLDYTSFVAFGPNCQYACIWFKNAVVLNVQMMKMIRNSFSFSLSVSFHSDFTISNEIFIVQYCVHQAKQLPSWCILCTHTF